MHIDNLIHNFSQNNLTQYLRTKISTFKPDDDDLSYLFDDEVFEKYESIDKIGEATINGDDLIIIASKTSDPLTEKSGKKNQYEIAKKILKEEVKDASIFVFYDDEGNFRFSFVNANYLGTKRNYSDFKRYTYFVNKDKPNNTFKRQVGECSFNSLDDIIKAFSVEPLNKLFYQEVSKAFYKLIGGEINIASKKYDFDAVLELPSTPLANRKIYQEFAVRLIGRTIFCWFLKNKKSEAKKPLIPENWLSSDTVDLISNGGLDYYHDYLEKLFFLILNKNQNERKDYKLPEGEASIPFLNGGLFEPHPDDFFPKDSKGIHKKAYNLKIPNEWFFEFFLVLEQFNFTIDENSISDAEVSIDPEMLGTIFENLLAEIDPDTAKSARNATGSFYTPREVVDYMIEQSLIQYLTTKTSIENENNLLKLFKEGGINEFNEEQTEEILEALNTVKILDPACGSGAFPMGALHKIITILHKLDPDATWWKQKQIENIPNALAKKMMQEKLDAASADYIRKLGVIQNSIYGIDIQSIATEISKLRSFLSLIIDENIDDNAENRGIEPLPNLEFKFVTANTLIKLPEEKEQKGLFDNYEELQLLEKLRADYLQSSGNKKNTIKERFLNVQKNAFKSQHNLFANTESRSYKLMTWNPFKDEPSSWFDSEWMFGVKDFDIVIANPPYIDSETMINTGRRALREYLVENYNFARGNWDIYIPFFEKGFDSLSENGILCFITPDKWISKGFGTTFREKMIYNLHTIVNAGRDVFETANVDALITLFKKSNTNKTYSYELQKNYFFYSLNTFETDDLESSFPYDLFFSNNIKWIIDLENKSKKIEDLIICESACATSDAYKLKEYVLELEDEFDNKIYYKVINTGTIGKYNSKWGEKEMKYLGEKYLNPVVLKSEFNTNFNNSYYQKSKQKKIIIKGLTLLDGCIDFHGEIIPGKSTLVLCSPDDGLLKFVSLIINSKLSIFLLKEKYGSSSYNGGVNFNKGMINNLLVPQNHMDIFSKMVDKFDLMLKYLDSDNNDEIMILENEINLLLYKSFDLSYEIVQIIDQQFKLTKKQYENYTVENES